MVTVHGKKNQESHQVLQLSDERHGNLAQRIENLIDAETRLDRKILARQLKGGKHERHQESYIKTYEDLAYHHHIINTGVAGDIVAPGRHHREDDERYEKRKKSLEPERYDLAGEKGATTIMVFMRIMISRNTWK
jgi:hypothetical protein